MPTDAVIRESIYDHPKYYDLVFGADCAAELTFIRQCAQQYAGVKVQRWFEPACGTGRLLAAFARQGFEVGGIDLNPKAVDFCNKRLQQITAKAGPDSPPALAWVADMADFTTRKKYDVAFNTINSFRHLTSEEASLAHLQCMGRAIRKGGLYLLGIHLTPTRAAPSETESWSARRGNLTVNTHMWTIERNRRQRVERFGIRFDIHTPTRYWRIEDVLVLRSYTQKQMQQLIDRSECWECVETFDFTYDIDSAIPVDATTEDVVYVLRRR